MIFSKTRPIKVVMIGTGGTGGHIAPHLYRLLYALDRPVKFILCDGDVVEEKNLVRQNSAAFGLETSYVPDFIESADRLEQLVTPETWGGSQYGRYPFGRTHDGRPVSELVILIGAVDNNRSRQMCHEVFMRSKELIYIDSGNGEYTGQVVCGIRRSGKTIYKPIGLMHPELFEDEDLFPSELSCAEASVSAPQTIVANLMAATAVVTIVYNILVLGDSRIEQTTFSTRSVGIRSTLKKSRKRRKYAA